MTAFIAPAGLAALAGAAMPRAIVGVRADASNPAQVLADLHKAFEDFKAENDRRLSAKADVVIDEKVERINSQISDLQATLDTLATQAAARSIGVGQQRADDPEYTELYASWFRDGSREHEIKAASRSGVRAAMSVGVPADGGYTAPIEWDRTIVERLTLISPMRQNSRVEQTNKPGWTQLIQIGGVGSGWVGETAARPATSTPTLAPMEYRTGQIYAFPFATQDLLEDSDRNIADWLVGEVDTAFAMEEGVAFLAGDGVNKPYGLLTFAAGGANAAAHPNGAIPVLTTGDAAGFTGDGIITAVYDLPARYAANAKFYANRLSLAAIRRLKDGNGNYLWQPSFGAGQPQTIGGQAVVEMPGMPNPTAGNIALAYGDMQATYLVVDRRGLRVVRDELTNKPFVGFYCTRRVGGAVYNPLPMRFVRIAA